MRKTVSTICCVVGIVLVTVFFGVGMYKWGARNGRSLWVAAYTAMLDRHEQKTEEAEYQYRVLEEGYSKLLKHFADWAPTDWQPCVAIYHDGGVDYYHNVHVIHEEGPRSKLFVKSRTAAGRNSPIIAVYQAYEWEKYVDIGLYTRENHGPLESEEALEAFQKKQTARWKDLLTPQSDDA